MSDLLNEAQTQGSQVGWHVERLENLNEGTRQVLEKYSRIPSEEVLEHVHKIRDAAWKIYQYPCIGLFRFTDLSLGQAKEYPEVLQRVKEGQRLLDMGCCFAQDIRRLIFDGAPAENIYGSDLENGFLDLGYELFRDRDHLKAHLFAADIFANNTAELDALDGTVDIIHASSFFHLFSLELQTTVARRFIKLLKPNSGSLILGRHMGSEMASLRQRMSGSENLVYRHDLESWKKMWDDVGKQTNTEWKVEAEWTVGKIVLDAGANAQLEKWQADGARQMRYTVRRV